MLRVLRHNWPYKLLALLFSILLWYDVKLHQEPFTVPVPLRLEFRGVPRDMLATSPVTQVTAVIYGPKMYASRVTSEKLSAYVDLRDAVPGPRRQEVVVEAAPGLKPLVTVLSVAPQKVDVTVRRKVHRSVPVTVEWSGQPMAGARYGRIRLDPPSVVVSGADDVVANVDRAVVRLGAGDPHITGRFPVSAVDSRGNAVAEVLPSPNTVGVDATLMQTQGRQQAFVSPAFNGQPADGYAIERVWTEPQVVTLVGAPEAVAGITSVPTRPISVEGASATVSRVVTVAPPRGVLALPDRVTVRVRIRRAP